jgi:hypothetical protein
MGYTGTPCITNDSTKKIYLFQILLYYENLQVRSALIGLVAMVSQIYVFQYPFIRESRSYKSCPNEYYRIPLYLNAP